MTQSQSQSQSQSQHPGPADAAADTLLLQSAAAEPGVWDEMRANAHALRPAWQRFAELLPIPTLPFGLAGELDRRAEQVAQQIRLDGVTHNVYSEQGTAARPWSLELLPLLIEPHDWAKIEAGVSQRAALLETMLADLQGAQRLLHEGLLPPALLYRHPGYLRPLHGVKPAGGQRLHIVAFDLARDEQGAWCVVAQRTQGPSGLGYVLHNRMLVSRQFPDAFRELRVQHIASSYRRLVDTVDAAARDLTHGATPRIVLLTPGPYNETYFEHAYLARYLGLPLVEGADLMVRNDHLYLKTVQGLEPVHGMLRRLDDEWCDPLELRSDSSLGVPGLVQAARAGTVVMANALGSAFLESPAVQGFLPAIARRLLGEELSLPSLPTWWCGEASAWDAVRNHVDDKLVRRTFPGGARAPALHERAASLIEQDPDAWTLQARLALSRAPLWGAGTITPRPAQLRVYAVADSQGRWFVLPGGMTRVAQGQETSVSMQRGGSSLDTWVMTDGPVDTFSMLPKRLSVDDIAQHHRPVASRTAEHLFWLGRYTERAEQLVRLARAVLLMVDASSDATATLQQAATRLAIKSGLAPWGVPGMGQGAHVFERAVLLALADPKAASVGFNLAALARTSQVLRERLSTEQWTLIRAMHEGFDVALRGDVEGGGGRGEGKGVGRNDGAVPSSAQALLALDRLAVQLAAVTGVQTDRMTRDQGWRFLTVGRLLERLSSLATRLQMLAETQAIHSPAGIDLLLDLFDSTITFRARYQRSTDLLALVDLLVFDNTNPRAFAGVLRRLRTELGKLPGVSSSSSATSPLLALLPAHGTGMSLASLRGADDAQIALQLQGLSFNLAQTAGVVADLLSTRYFTLAPGAEHVI